MISSAASLVLATLLFAGSLHARPVARDDSSAVQYDKWCIGDTSANSCDPVCCGVFNLCDSLAAPIISWNGSDVDALQAYSNDWGSCQCGSAETNITACVSCWINNGQYNKNQQSDIEEHVAMCASGLSVEEQFISANILVTKDITVPVSTWAVSYPATATFSPIGTLDASATSSDVAAPMETIEQGAGQTALADGSNAAQTSQDLGAAIAAPTPTAGS